jgi:hypothetical protein
MICVRGETHTIVYGIDLEDAPVIPGKAAVPQAQLPEHRDLEPVLSVRGTNSLDQS